MVWIDSIADLEANNPNLAWGCYGDPVFEPHDILLQAFIGDSFDYSTNYTVKLLKPDGTLIGDISSYFDYYYFSATIAGNTYYYVNLRCDRYSASMISNGCFVLDVNIKNAGGVSYFHKYTQRYLLNNSVVLATGVSVSYTAEGENISTLCAVPSVVDNCRNTYTELAAIFDCMDTFTGDYYGNGDFIGSNRASGFPFFRKTHIQGYLRKMPKEIKRTTSINCRAQKSETTPKYTLYGDVPFPIWKVEEIENMLLANHIFVEGTEYQTEGGTPFSQFGKPQGQNRYVYKMEIPLLGCYAWQTYGCTPVCDSQTYYYPIP